MVAPTTATREVYPNAPLRLVAAELRYPTAPGLLGPEALAKLAGPLKAAFPAPYPFAAMEVTLGPDQAPSVAPGAGYRFMSRDSMSSFTVTPTRCILETTNYQRWETFRSLLELTLQVLGRDLDAISAVERFGLRYVNEVRIPTDTEDLGVWREYVATELLAPYVFCSNTVGGPLSTGYTLVQTRTPAGTEIIFRHGLLKGHMIKADPLRLPTELRDGPYFLMDIDSFFDGSGGLLPFDLEAALTGADELHQPVRSLFEGSITSKLRDTVLRRSNGE